MVFHVEIRILHFDFISGLDKVTTSYLVYSIEDRDDQKTSRTILNKLLIAAFGFMLSGVFL